MREIVRQSLRFFVLTALGGLALRLLLFFTLPKISEDSFIYGDLAKNWLLHGIYGISVSDGIQATCSRLPGYPAFLAGVFAIFGMEHYRAALLIQIFVDLGTCLVIADIARRMISPKAAKAAFLLAALCPFLASYAAAALTETWEIFFTSLALDCAVAGIGSLLDGRLRPWVGCGAAIGAAILLRPDGGILLAAVVFYLAGLFLWQICKFRKSSPIPNGHILRALVTVGAVAAATLIPWTIRNLHTMHQFQPLAPRYANESDELVPRGFNRWTKTWIVDYVSVEEIYWNAPGQKIEIKDLPRRAFDSEAQRAQTEQLFDDYNQNFEITPSLDARFQLLAGQRIQTSPFRYYLKLPFLRILDMWLRPRTELVPADTRWWEFDDSPGGTILAIGLGTLGLFYLAAAFTGVMKQGIAPAALLLMLFVAIRSAFLGTLENPEPRYVLECFPVIFVLISLNFSE